MTRIGHVFFGAAVLGLACSQVTGGRSDAEPSAQPIRAKATPQAVDGVMLPSLGTGHSPALVQLESEVDGLTLADTDGCQTCHAGISRQWRSSAHALSSFNNPIYRASFDRFAAANGPQASRFCAGCHDPTLLVDGAVDSEGAIEAAAVDPRGHAGVGCRTCHSIVHATFEGNGSYTLSGFDVPIPEEGKPETVTAHVERVRPDALGTAAMCGSCHRASLGAETGHPHGIAGTDDLGPWMQSAFAGASARLDDDVADATCNDCHMKTELARDDLAADDAGMVASHRFVGGHTWLSAMTGDAEHLAQTQALLRESVSIDVAGLRTAGGERVLPEDGQVAAGEALELDVVLRNRSVGHRFPGGTRDAQAAWVQVQVLDATGEVIAATDPADRHEFRAHVADEDGQIRDVREIEDFRTPVVDHTIAPRDAVVTRHSLVLPATLALPLRVEARLMHQSRTDALQDVTCERADELRGRQAREATRIHLGVQIDPCAEQPTTEIDAVEITLGSGSAPDTRWRRRYEHGLGLLHDVQEHAADAQTVLELALADLGDGATDRQRAMILGLLSEVATRQGRFDDAIALADQVDAFVPDEPSTDLLRARAHAGAWRWDEAAPIYARAATALPDHEQVWSETAKAWQSTGASSHALRAAQSGLAVAPRQEALLRIQALALQALEHSGAEAAWQAYEERRPSDRAPGVKAACRRNDPTCAKERLPVHVHALAQ